MSFKKILPNIIILLIAFSLIYTMFNVRFWKKDKIIEWDVISYYAYLPATFIYKDLSLDFIDTYDGDHEFTIWPSLVPNGNKVIKTSMGLSYCYAPFFFLAHISAHIKDYNTGGYSAPYRFFLQLGTVVFVLLGLVFLKKVLLQFFNPLVSAITIAILFIGTNLFHYTVYEPGMPHAYNFSLICIFLYYTIAWHKTPKIWMSIVIGILAGIITLIRPTNILIILIIIFWNISSWYDIQNRIKLFINNYLMVLIILLSAFVVWIPQLIYWKKITGEFLYFSYGNERFFFLRPQIIYGLFSFRKGWFLYTPVMIFAVVGIFLLYKNKNIHPWAIPVTLFTILNLYIVFSWWTWWYGGCFGQRALIDSYGILSIPMAAFLTTIIKKKPIIKLPVLILFFFTVALGLFHTIQYYYGAIHWDAMTKEAYFDSFGRIKPSERFELLISPPDYDKAIRGEKEYFPNKEENILFEATKTIRCGAEKLSLDSNFLISDTEPTVLFEGAIIRTSEQAFTGQYSLQINSDNPFGFTYRINNYTINDKFQVSIWRNGNKNSHLVVAASDIKKLYKTTNEPVQKENGWEHLQMSFIVPIMPTNDPILVYVWNPDTATAYFDDISISKLNE